MAYWILYIQGLNTNYSTLIFKIFLEVKSVSIFTTHIFSRFFFPIFEIATTELHPKHGLFCKMNIHQTNRFEKQRAMYFLL